MKAVTVARAAQVAASLNTDGGPAAANGVAHSPEPITAPALPGAPVTEPHAGASRPPSDSLSIAPAAQHTLGSVSASVRKYCHGDLRQKGQVLDFIEEHATDEKWLAKLTKDPTNKSILRVLEGQSPEDRQLRTAILSLPLADRKTLGERLAEDIGKQRAIDSETSHLNGLMNRDQIRWILEDSFNRVRDARGEFGRNPRQDDCAAALALYDQHKVRFNMIAEQFLAGATPSSSDQAFLMALSIGLERAHPSAVGTTKMVSGGYLAQHALESEVARIRSSGVKVKDPAEVIGSRPLAQTIALELSEGAAAIISQSPFPTTRATSGGERFTRSGADEKLLMLDFLVARDSRLQHLAKEREKLLF